MTALWEQALDDVAAGRLELHDFMARQAGMVEKLVQHARESTVTMPQSKSKTPGKDAGSRRKAPSS